MKAFVHVAVQDLSRKRSRSQQPKPYSCVNEGACMDNMGFNDMESNVIIGRRSTFSPHLFGSG